jgi:hypothetical protein
MFNTETGVANTQLIEVESNSDRTIYAVKYQNKYIGEVTAWAGNAAFGVDWTTDETGDNCPVLYSDTLSYSSAKQAVSVLIERYQHDVVMQVCAGATPRIYIFKAAPQGAWYATRLGCGTMPLRRLCKAQTHDEALAYALKYVKA